MTFLSDNNSEASLEAFEDLVRKHEGSIYRVAYRLAGNREDAEDLIQETLIEAFEAFRQFRAGTRFDRWVYRIMTNTHIDVVRKRARTPRMVSIDDNGSENGTGGEIDIQDSTNDPAVRLLTNQLSEPLQKSLDALSPEARSVLVLADVEGHSYEEVARALGCPVGTVRSRLHRARMAFKNYLAPYLSSGRFAVGRDEQKSRCNEEETE